jgi:hypothetical protein
MVTPSADPTASGRSPQRRRAWQRRPLSRRLDLTPEQIEAQEAERRSKLRTAGLRIQLTPDERAEIERRAKASGNRLSDYARIVLLSDLKAPMPPARDPEAMKALAFQLSKIGTNLNQLAKYTNERRALPHDADLKGLSEQIVAALEKVYGL